MVPPRTSFQTTPSKGYAIPDDPSSPLSSPSDGPASKHFKVRQRDEMKHLQASIFQPLAQMFDDAFKNGCILSWSSESPNPSPWAWYYFFLSHNLTKYLSVIQQAT
jgi:hypothetical protein